MRQDACIKLFLFYDSVTLSLLCFMSECRRPPPTLFTELTSTVCAGIEPTFPHRQCGALDLWTNKPFARLCVTNLTIYVRPVIASHNCFILYVASFEPTIGIAGLEPTNYGTKARCLTVLAIFLVMRVAINHLNLLNR